VMCSGLFLRQFSVGVRVGVGAEWVLVWRRWVWVSCDFNRTFWVSVQCWCCSWCGCVCGMVPVGVGVCVTFRGCFWCQLSVSVAVGVGLGEGVVWVWRRCVWVCLIFRGLY